MKIRHSSIAVLLGLALAGTLQGAESRAGSARALSPTPPQPPALETTRPPEPPELPELAEVRAAAETGAADVAETIRGQVERAARDAERQMKAMRGSLSRLRTNLGETYLQGGGPHAFRSLVLPLGDEPRDAGAIKEELAIMGRLIEKSLQPESERKSNPFRLEFGGIHLGGRNDLDALYLEGYGVVFFIEVDYPLAAAPAREEKAAPTQAAKDDAWEQARREVRGEPDPDDDVAEVAIFGNESRPFDPARVEALRARLIEALQQARNLKCLRESETVTLVVSGAGPREGAYRKARSVAAAGGGDRSQLYFFDAAGGAGRGMGSVMTLRVGKTDLDSLGAGRLKPEEFGSKVRVANRLETPGEPEPKPEDGARKRRPGR